MKFRVRVAAFAAIISCAATATTAPGLAFEVDRTPIAGLELTRYELATAPSDPSEAAILPETSDQASSTPAQPAEPAVAETGDYASLQEAVAAQVVPHSPDEELECLATGIYFESKGEPLSGQLAVAEVILNRARSGRFPGSVCSVLTQRGQFSFVRGGRLPSVDRARATWRTAVAVAKVARKNLWDSPANSALFFHARYVRPNWNRAKIASIGNHIFYR